MNTAHSVAAGLALAVTSLSPALQAQGWQTDRQIAYQGHLELDGEPQSGSYDFYVELWLDPAATDTAQRVWWDELSAVPVYAGAFALVLGSIAHPLSDQVFQADALYLAVKVRRSGVDPDYTALASRQRLLAVPYAARTYTGKDIITVNLSVSGAASFGSSGARVASCGGGGGALTLTGEGSAPSRQVTVLDNLRVENRLQVAGGQFGAYETVVVNDAGVSWSTPSAVATSDLIAIVSLWSNDNGDRCWANVKVTPPGGTEIIVARVSAHYYTNSDTHVPTNAVSVPVPKDHTWLVSGEDTAGDCVKGIRTVAVAR